MKALVSTLFAAAFALTVSAFAQGMPPAARENIHRLFDNHAKIKRTVTLTETGYIATTESDDPQMAKTLRSHVSQMQDRLEGGLFVRRWDPAYDEMVRHYKDLDLKTEPTKKGLRVVMNGKTPEAIKIAQNHAQIVSKFSEKGWAEHDVKHPAVAQAFAQIKTGGASADPASCCQKPSSSQMKGQTNGKKAENSCGQCQTKKDAKTTAP